MNEAERAEEELAVLRHLTALLVGRREPLPRWETLFANADPRSARATYFLLGGASGGRADGFVGVHSFVHESLLELSRKLGCRTARRAAEYRGSIRGLVLWQATLKSRLSGGHDPTRFVCREVRRYYDTPENQLLKYVIASIRSCLDLVPDVIASGVCFDGGEGRRTGTIGELLDGVDAILSRLKRHVRLRDVTLPETVTPRHLRAAETSKTEEYGLVAALYRRFEATVLAASWIEVARAGWGVLALPARRGEDGDPWIRLAAEILHSAPAERGAAANAVRTAIRS